MASRETPDQWAQGKRSRIESMARGAVAAAIRAAVPVISPGVPVCAWVGVCANGSATENTTGWVKGDQAEREQAARDRRTPIRLGSQVYDPADRNLWSNKGFHELGLLGVEGGDASAVVPAQGSPWLQGARDADVRRVLGREGVTALGAWRNAVPDQVAIGMWNNARHAVGVARKLPAGLAPRLEGAKVAAPWDQWDFVCATMGWSAGDTGASNHLKLFPDVANAPPAERFSVYTRTLVQRGRPGRAGVHSNAFYSTLRTWQKLQAGVLAASFTGEGDAGARWCAFVGADRAEVFAALTRGATGGGSSSSSSGSSSSSRGSTGSSSSSSSSGSDASSSSSSPRRWVAPVLGLLGGVLVLAGGAFVVRRLVDDGETLEGLALQEA